MRTVGPDPEQLEMLDVSELLALAASIRRLGAPNLLHARMNWDRLFNSANPPGAATPAVAKNTLSRDANRRKHARQKALRSGEIGLLRAIHWGGLAP